MSAPAERIEAHVGARVVSLSNLDKVLWPATGTTKGAMIDYYRRVAPAILPHLRGRALTLARFPDGVTGRGFFQMNCRGEPEWMHVVTLPARRGGTLRYCVVDDEASLVWAANWGAIELHPFLARADDEQRPYAMVLDVDPGPPAGVLLSAHVALLVRDALAAHGLASYAKTSGAKGIHVYVPLGGAATFAEIKPFARNIAHALAMHQPAHVTSDPRKAARAGKVYIDWAQNDPRKSTVAPYSLRATLVPRVSTPVGWEEVEGAVAARDPRVLSFDPSEVVARLEHVGDLFAPVTERVQRLPAP